MTASNPVPLMTVGAIAKRLNCSARTVYRLCDAGRMSLPL
jgi:excisionase family DNA binding protein